MASIFKLHLLLMMHPLWNSFLVKVLVQRNLLVVSVWITCVVHVKGTYWEIDIGPGIGNGVAKIENQAWPF